MPMPKFITKLRRQAWCNQVVASGRSLDKLYRYRAGLDPSLNTELYGEFEITTAQIDRLERRLQHLRNKLKETA